MRVLRILAALAVAVIAPAEVVRILIPGPGPLYPIQRDRKWGYMDRTGKTVIRPQFDAANDFYNGFAAVTINKKVGFINEQGRLQIQPQFDFAGEFTGALAPVRIGRLWGYVAGDGRMAVPPQFQEASNFLDGMARVGRWDRLTCGDREFTKDNAEEYWFMLGWIVADSISCFPVDEKYGFVNERGELAVQPQYGVASNFSEGLASVAAGYEEKTGYIDRTGATALAFSFEQGGDFREGLAPVQTNGKWGFIDRIGAIVIAPTFDFADSFRGGVALIVKDSDQGYVDKSGRPAPKPMQPEGPIFVNGVAIVERAGYQYFYIDSTGREIARRD